MGNTVMILLALFVGLPLWLMFAVVVVSVCRGDEKDAVMWAGFELRDTVSKSGLNAVAVSNWDQAAFEVGFHRHPGSEG